jgi:hypothetical protein
LKEKANPPPDLQEKPVLALPANHPTVVVPGNNGGRVAMQTRDFSFETPVGPHPLDQIEQIVTAQESWPFDRAHDDELNVSASGSWCDYHLTFTWREEIEALHAACAFDIKVPFGRRNEVYRLLALINEQMWIGHFDLWSDEGVILFRHSALMHGGAHLNPSQSEALVRLAIEACERFYPAFQFVLWGGKGAEDALAAIMLETEGNA